jgi:hypothetical protein
VGGRREHRLKGPAAEAFDEPVEGLEGKVARLAPREVGKRLAHGSPRLRGGYDGLHVQVRVVVEEAEKFSCHVATATHDSRGDGRG